MATLGELNILVNIKGLSSVKSGLDSLNKQTEETSNQFKSAAESASVFEAQFKKQDIQLKKSQQQFKSFVSDLRSVGRELTQLGSIIRNDSLVVVGAFSAAFVSTRDIVPKVNDDLIELSHSLNHISESISRSAEPSLEKFVDQIKKIELTVGRVAKVNPELINSFLKFAGIGAIIGTIIITLGTLFKSLNDIIRLLRTFGVITATGALSGAAGTFLAIASAVGATYIVVEKLKKSLEGIANGKLLKVLEAMQAFGPAGTISPLIKRIRGQNIQPGGGSFGGKGASGSFETPESSQTHQLSKAELTQSMTAAAAQIENVNQRAQQAIENTLAMANAVREQIGSVFVSLADGIGQSVAASIVFGQNFLESMQNVLKQLAADIISLLVSVIAKIVVLRALGVVGPIPAAALFGGGQGFGEAVGGTQAGKGIGGFFKNFLGFAEGGIVTKPTLGVFGEAGPEAVIPLDKMGSMGGSVTINFNGHTFLKDEASMDYLVRRATDALKRATRRRNGGLGLSL